MIDAAYVKEHVDIAGFIGRYVKLTKAGAKEYVGLCPFHQETTPSFTVTPSKGLYVCFGCQASGDVFRFIEMHEGLSFPDAVKRVAELEGVAGADAERPVQAKAPEPAWEQKAAYSYNDENGELLYDVIRLERHENGVRKKSFRQRPAGADAGGKWSMDGVRRVLYRLPSVIASDVIVLVEGEKDVHSLEAAGFTATTNSGGANGTWTEEHTAALAGKKIILIPDADKPGEAWAEKITAALKGKAEVVPVKLSTGKDVTEFFEAGKSGDDLRKLIEKARREQRRVELEDRGLLSVTEIVENFEGGIGAFLDPSQRGTGLKTGMAGIDRITGGGLRGGELIVLAARPAMGKTALAMNIAQYVATKERKPVAVFSLEMSAPQLLTRMLCSSSEVPLQKHRGGFANQQDRRKMQAALAELADSPLYLDDTPGLGLPGLGRRITRMADEHGLSLVVIDYMQLMSGGKAENRTQEVGAISRGLKLLSMKFDVPFLVLSQLNRSAETRPGNHIPMLSDLRESGSIEQDSDVVMFLYREEVYRRDKPEIKGQADLTFAKQRNGPTGKVPLRFIGEIARFLDSDVPLRDEEAA